MSKSNRNFRIGRFPFFVRQAEKVARGVLRHGFGKDYLPLSLEGNKNADGTAEVVFRHEESLRILVRLFNLSSLAESWRARLPEEWVVYEIETNEGMTLNLECFEENIGDVRYVPKDEILGEIGIYFSNVANEGYIEDDPDNNNQGHFNLQDSVNYKILVPGDKERAHQEARKRLNAMYAAD